MLKTTMMALAIVLALVLAPNVEAKGKKPKKAKAETTKPVKNWPSKAPKGVK